jgi:TonB family protein
VDKIQQPVDSLRDIVSVKDDSPNGLPVYTKDAVPPPVVWVDTLISKHRDIHTIVEQMPNFPEGQVALHKYLRDSLHYPPVAQENGIEGKVYIRFVVDTNGELTHIGVRRGLQEDCDKEAIRLIRAMPKWIPGRHQGKLVKVSYVLPIKFNLE